jgi:hypothetical protein
MLVVFFVSMYYSFLLLIVLQLALQSNTFENILVLARVLAIACAERKGQKEDRPDVEPIFWHCFAVAKRLD